MAWWDDLMNGFGVQNQAAGVNADVERLVGDQRSPSGSFDPNRVKGILPSEMGPEVDAIGGLTNMRVDAMRDSMQMPSPKWNEWLGMALQDAGGVVGIAQGTPGAARSFGTMGSFAYNDRKQANEDALRKGTTGAVDGAYGSLGTSAVDYMKGQREKKAEMRKTLAGILAAGRRDDGTIDPASVADADLYVDANGFARDEWDAIKTSIKGSIAPASAPVAPGAPPQAPQAPVAARPSNGSMLGDLSSMASKLPGAQGAPAAPGQAPGAPAKSLAYSQPPEIAAMYAKAQRMMAIDPVRGKAMLESAQIADRAAAAVWQKQAESQFDARNGEWSTSNTMWGVDENGEPIVIQPGSKGEGKAMKLPPGVKLTPPDVMAGNKASLKTQGTAQGTAVASLPKVDADYELVNDVLLKVRTAPGLKNLTGKMFGGLAWADQVPNFYEETGDAAALVENLNSKAFSQAFETLKGAGAITEAEGKAATAALTRLQNMRVSDEAYAEALDDFKMTVDRLKRQAYEKAQLGYTLPGQQPPPSGGGKYSNMSNEDFLKSRTSRGP